MAQGTSAASSRAERAGPTARHPTRAREFRSSRAGSLTQREWRPLGPAVPASNMRRGSATGTDGPGGHQHGHREHRGVSGIANGGHRCLPMKAGRSGECPNPAPALGDLSMRQIAQGNGSGAPYPDCISPLARRSTSERTGCASSPPFRIPSPCRPSSPASSVRVPALALAGPPC
jgi:hypothetical protein